MVEHGIETMDCTPVVGQCLLVDFCECKEFVKMADKQSGQMSMVQKHESNGATKPAKNQTREGQYNNNNFHNKTHEGQYKNYHNNKRPYEHGHFKKRYDPSKYCALHGIGHDTGACEEMMKQAEKMKAAYASTSHTQHVHNKRALVKHEYKKMYAIAQTAFQDQQKKKKQRHMHTVTHKNGEDDDTTKDDSPAVESDSSVEEIYQFNHLNLS